MSTLEGRLLKGLVRMASAEGSRDVGVQLADHLGGSALQEACKAGHDSVVALLRKNNAE